MWYYGTKAYERLDQATLSHSSYLVYDFYYKCKKELSTLTVAELDKMAFNISSTMYKVDSAAIAAYGAKSLYSSYKSAPKVIPKGAGKDASALRSEGKPYENHTTVQKTDTVRKLSTTGKPNSSVHLYDENGTLTQRRYYDENGRAVEDIDYEHSNGDNSHVFPHRHTWDWSQKIPRSK